MEHLLEHRVDIGEDGVLTEQNIHFYCVINANNTLLLPAKVKIYETYILSRGRTGRDH